MKPLVDRRLISSAAEAADYKERVTKLYLDFAPVEQEFRRAIVHGQ